MQLQLFLVSYVSLERRENGEPKHSGSMRVEASNMDDMTKFFHRALGSSAYKITEVQRVL